MTNARWKPSPPSRKYGVAISSYAGDLEHSLSLEIGETVHILEEYFIDDDDNTAVWYLGCSFGNKNKRGIFPCNHIQTKNSLLENEGPYETVTPIEDAVVKELTFVLREWLVRWKSIFVNRNMSLYHSIWLVMGELVKYRSTLVSDTLTKEQALELKQQVVTIIDWGNGNLDMDLVPRVEYKQAEPDEVSVVEMYRIHQKSVENCQGAGPGGKVSVKKKKEVQGEIIHNVLVEFRNFACTVADCCEVLLSLYDESESRFISENFLVNIDKEGHWKGWSQSNSNDPSTLFTDLSQDDIRKDIFLVVQIVRKGVLLLEGNMKKMPTQPFRRPWGVSVLNLRDLFQIQPENGMEYFLRVQCVDSESQFSTLHEHLIKRHTNMTGRGGSTDKQNQGINLSIKLVFGELKNAKIEHPLLINKGLVITPRMGFSDFINPGEVRNDLYLTIFGAEFDRGNKKASKNVLVQVTVYNDEYEVIDSCISSANGTFMTSNFFSCVFYHSNSPRWNETIKLCIPIETFNASHIRLELSHCSSQDKQAKKLFGFAYLDLTTRDKVTRQNGSYELCVYKVEDGNKIKNYLRLPSLQDDFNDPKVMTTIPSNIPFPRGSKEYITVKTFLCSSKFAQKTELLRVLQWSSLTDGQIQTSLDNLVKIKGQELVRYLQDVLDALFNMFNAGANGSRVCYALSIFQALIHIFNLLQEEMFDKFACVLEDFLEKSFSSPVAHRDMMYCLRHMVEQIYTCTDFDESVESKRVFKVLEDIFKFSVKSCMLSQRMYGGDQLMSEFHNSLDEVFKTFGKLLQSSEHVLNKAQNQLLMNIHKCFTPLLQIMSPEDLAKLIVFLMGKIHKEASSTVLRGKTQLIKNTIGSPLLTDPTSRNMLLPLIVAHLKRCFIQQRHLALSSNCFADLLSCIFTLKQTCDVQEEITKIVQGMFDVTVRLLWNLTQEQSKEVGSLLTSCLTEMLRLMDVKHYQKLMSDYPKPNPLKDFLNRILLVFNELVSNDVFPADWTTMRMITNNIMLTSIQYIAADLTDNFLQGAEFDRELWTNFFLLAVAFITQPALQLEKYSEAKSGQITDRYSDMRVPVGCQIYSLWNQIDENTQVLVMDLLGPFLKVSMIPQVELRKATIPIFFDIMRWESKTSGDLRRMEAKMIHELDFLVLEHHGDAAYKDLLGAMLLDKLQTEPEMEEDGKRFVFSVTDLLERLLDYRAIMDREEQRDTKMHCTFNILNFYKDNREDMYIRYISRLNELHYSASNFVEAGLTLRLYANLLTWSDKMLPAEMSYPTQTEMDRKEDLFFRIFDCFDKGKSWEYGIPLCKDLAEHYENTFQYKKLGQLLQRQASFLYQILEGNKIRQDPTYYRVAYYGTSFPPYLKNKAFIYRGDECLKLSTIIDQLKTEYPLASILQGNSPPDESYKQGDAQYIQLVSVKPVPGQHTMFAGKTVPSEISSFYQCNEVDTFQFDRPYHRPDKDKMNEFKSLCLERTILKTSYKLPGILRWYEVVNTQIVQLSPVQTATDTVQQMNAELRSSTQKAISNPEQHLRHLEMRLQGVISGAVNGGIPKYQEAFFNEEYTSKYPADKDFIEDLKCSIHEQLQLLERGLKLHGKHASPEMQPLHKVMLEGFDKMKTSMGYQTSQGHTKRGSSVVSLALSSNRPSTPSSTSLNSSGSNRSSVVSGCEIAITEVENPYDEADNREAGNVVTSSAPSAPSFPIPPPYPQKRATSLRNTSSSSCSFPNSNEIGGGGGSPSYLSPPCSSNRPRSANMAVPTRQKQVLLPQYSRAESQPCLSSTSTISNNNNNNFFDSKNLLNQEDKDQVPPMVPPRKKSFSESGSVRESILSMRSPTQSVSTPPPLPLRTPPSSTESNNPPPHFRAKTQSEGDYGSNSTPPRPPRAQTQISSPAATTGIGITSAATPPPPPPIPAKRTNSTSSSSSLSSPFNSNSNVSQHGSVSSLINLNATMPPPSPHFNTAGDSLYLQPPPAFEDVINSDNAYPAPPPSDDPPPSYTPPPAIPASQSDKPQTQPQPHRPPIPKKLSLIPGESNNCAISTAVAGNPVSPKDFSKMPTSTMHQSAARRPPPRTSILRSAHPIQSTAGLDSNSMTEPPPLPKRKQSNRL